MKNRIFGCTVVFLLLLAGRSSGQQPDCLPNTILVKWKVGSVVQGAPSLLNVLQTSHPELWVSNVEPLLPTVPVSNSNYVNGQAVKSAETVRLESELARVCIVHYAAGIDPLSACCLAASVEGVEYAEPYPVCYPLGALETPNDSLFAQQAFLKTVQAEQAWDICSGNSQTVIAVTDTDIKWDHPDLVDNIWINPGEDGVDGQGNSKRTNGVDDDGNGYVDDWHGWDFAGTNNVTGDNDTRSTSGGHGTAVAGLAGAVTNNKIGVASISHSCKILPIKIGTDGGGSLSFGLQGINYASLMGAKICNASWGTTAYSKTMEDMVALATSRGTLVVGGAGNNGNMVPFYPASFPAVLDAGVCTANDVINSGSTYGTTVDVFTPGDGALTVNISNGYSTFGATSAASPLASSLAALVAIHFPSYTPAQILERIRVTADNIDAKNPSRAFLSGRGRINAYRALSDPASPSVRITSYTVDDPNDDGRLDPGEEISLSLNLKNYLDAAPGPVTINLTAVTNPASVTITKGTVTLSAMPAGATMGTALDPLRFSVVPSTNYDATVIFKVEFVSGSYTGYDYVQATVNPSYNTIQSGDLALTVSANGNLGYLDYPDNTMGSGMTFEGGSLMLYMGAVMAGTDQSHIVDVARKPSDYLGRRNDFKILEKVSLNQFGAYQYASCRFDDSKADSARKLNIEVRDEVWDLSSDNITNVLFNRYRVYNKGTAALTQFRFGLFMDFGGYPAYYKANVYYDSSIYTAYISKTGFPVVGTFVIPDTLPGDRAPIFWGINNDQSVSGNPFGTFDGFTDAEKWKAMSTRSGNMTVTGGNLSFVLTAAPRDIPAGGYVDYVFGHAAAYSIGEVQQAVQDGLLAWQSSPISDVKQSVALPEQLEMDAPWPNPCRRGLGMVQFNFAVPRTGYVLLEVMSILGERVRTVCDGNMEAGMHSVSCAVSGLPAGAYICRLHAGGSIRTARLLIMN